MKKWFWHVALGFAGIVIIALAGQAFREATYQRSALSDYPPPGRLIDIGGRKIQLDCRGTGTPIVVFESGLDVWGSLSWRLVHDEIAKTTRACAYSRAGILWSDPSDGPHDGTAIATDLHAALHGAGERPPYILAGHSLGGSYSLLYNKLFGDDVVGFVLVDPSHPDQWKRFESATGKQHKPPPIIIHVLARMPWLGLRGSVQASAPIEEKIKTAFAPKGFLATTLETEAWDQTFAETRSATHLDARPLIVLSAMKPYTTDMLEGDGITAEQALKFQEALSDLHAEMASWSSVGEHRIVADSAHYIQLERPDRVIQAINDVIERVRAK